MLINVTETVGLSCFLHWDYHHHCSCVYNDSFEPLYSISWQYSTLPVYSVLMVFALFCSSHQFNNTSKTLYLADKDGHARKCLFETSDSGDLLNRAYYRIFYDIA